MRLKETNMTRGSRGFHCLAALALAGWLGASVSARQAPAQAAPETGPMSEQVFSSVTLLRGIPVDTFFEAMGMFASAMGEDCTFCHVSASYFDKSAFAKPTPRIQRARQMIVMMNALNKQYFAGQARVTCFTCHGGGASPMAEPEIARQYSAPHEDPNARAFPLDDRATAQQVWDAYVKAAGGAGAFAKLTSIAAKGMYAGFDTGFEKVPVEVYGRAPGQQAMVVHFSTGVSTRVYDGRSGWMAGPDTPVPLVTLNEGNLDRARLEAMIDFPAGLPNAYPQWRVGRTDIDGKQVRILQGLQAGQPAANFYFDETGILIRLVRWTRTPVGLVPTQIDLTDYRDVAGVKIPFKRTVTQTYMQMSVEINEIVPNATIDAARFAKPAPVTRPAA